MNDYKAPHLRYEAKFDITKVDAVEATMEEIARKWNLRPYKKGREQMKVLTQGKDAFFIVLYYNDDPVLSAGNSGFGELIFLTAMDYGHMPVDDLERLTAEVIKTLEERFGIAFKDTQSLQRQSG